MTADNDAARKKSLGIPSKKNPPWWPTAEQKRHADAGCAHPDDCRITCGAQYGRNPEACYHEHGHPGPHSNRYGTTWPSAIPPARLASIDGAHPAACYEDGCVCDLHGPAGIPTTRPIPPVVTDDGDKA